MITKKQLWVLTGGNGAGKSTFYRLFLSPRGIKFVNADLIAREIDTDNPEKASYGAAGLALRIIEDLIENGVSFCYETVFSHESKIDIIAKAKANNYVVILVYIHLEMPELNEARVSQRVAEGGHNVPADKIRNRIPRSINNIRKVLPLVDEARILDNSSRDDPFIQAAVLKKRKIKIADSSLPVWAETILCDFL